MTDADFHQAIRRIRRLHWLHYPAQALLMGGAVLAAGSRTAVSTTLEPRLATWPALLLLGALVPVAGLLLFGLYRRMRGNLRRPAEENLRIYQSRVFLRNSLLSLLALPLLASYTVTHQVLDLVAGAVMLLALSWRLAPTAATYQRWLLS
ncbi:hypothetical protein [Hymenobacter sp.]|uniref:hypothetical protein n=1 Tax=Hymenobacter sp. TaxID=1898978 RepID=UPI00286BCBF5|nr:hypothetical protein [Hymenobacter sp.]